MNKKKRGGGDEMESVEGAGYRGVKIGHSRDNKEKENGGSLQPGVMCAETG